MLQIYGRSSVKPLGTPKSGCLSAGPLLPRFPCWSPSLIEMQKLTQEYVKPRSCDCDSMWASTAGEGKQLTAWCQLTCGVGQTAVAPRRSRWQSLGSFNSCREARTQSCSSVTPHIFVSSVRPHLGRSSMFCVLLFFNHKIPIHRHSSAWTVERLSCGSAVRHCCGRELQAAGEYPPEASDGLASRPGVPNYDPRPNRAEPSIHNSQAKNYFYIFKQIKKKKMTETVAHKA